MKELSSLSFVPGQPVGCPVGASGQKVRSAPGVVVPAESCSMESSMAPVSAGSSTCPGAAAGLFARSSSSVVGEFTGTCCGTGDVGSSPAQVAAGASALDRSVR